MHGPRLDFVLLWHMHQPDYRDYATGEFTLPWVYLHALKDYSDMAAYLETHPGMHAVVNFVPILLDQIEDYAEQLTHGQPARSAAPAARQREPRSDSRTASAGWCWTAVGTPTTCA